MPPQPSENKRLTRHRGKSLCLRCQKLDIGFLQQTIHRTVLGNFIRRKSLATKPYLPTCALCTLFDQAYGAFKHDRDRRYQLRSLSSRRIMERGWASVDTIMLSMDGAATESYLVPQINGVGPVRLLGPRVDFKLLLEWIDHCRKSHTQDCGKVDELSQLSSMGSFKVIDCRARRVVPWAGQPYATLSYVWGSDSSAPEFSWELPDEVPEIIEDAVELTRRLNIGHLWVDRYCINQSKREEVVDQVGKMDVIYKESAITIIGATGEGSDNNLPGVRRDRTLRQPHATIGRYQLVSSMEDPKKNIKASKWWTRGWTYQEGLLARRRLIFTDEQVYFECRGMHCCEALKFDLPALHVKNGQRFAHQYRNGLNLGLFPARFGHKSWEVVERIGEYSTRTLTNPNDVLNGFSGVLSAFEGSPQHQRHLFGVPIMPQAPKPTANFISSEEGQAFLDSRVWTPTIGFLAGLAWISEERLTRRPVMPPQPTWSWTGWAIPIDGGNGGWTGSVQWAFREETWRRFQGDTDLQVSVELADGRILPWGDFYSQHNPLSARVTNTLHVSAWTTPIIFLCRRDQIKLMVQALDGKILEWSLSWGPDKLPGLHHLRSRTPVLAMQLGKVSGDRPETYVLVIAQVLPGVYERVGLGVWTHSCLQEAHARNEEPRPLCVPYAEPPLLSMKWESFQLR